MRHHALGQAAVPVGGGEAWPDNESTRRAAAHGHIK